MEVFKRCRETAMHTVELWVLTFHMTAESQDLPGIYSHYTTNEQQGSS